MHIVIDARKLGDFGIGSYIQGLGAACSQLAPEHTFTFLGPAAAQSLPRPLRGANVRWRQNRSKNYSLTELVSISRQVRRIGADVFHAPHYIFPLMLPCPGVVTIHDCIHLRFPEQLPNRAALFYARYMLRRAVRQASCVITGSEATRSDLVELVGADPAKIEAISYGCDPIFFQTIGSDVLAATRSEMRVEAPFLLYAGNVKPHKNLDRLLRAFAQLAPDYPDLHLLLVGGDLDGHPSLQRTYQQLGLEQRIRFLGRLPRTRLHALYQLADVFVFPSLYEGFGLPPLEAMASGTPVVAARSSSLPEIIGDAGVLVDPYEIDAIAAGIRRLLDDAELRRTLAAGGRQRAQRFSWRRAGRKVLQIYSRVAG
ncbi:MAG: glycosyltransferase family 4 protein [Acidobacteriota bacterium]